MLKKSFQVAFYFRVHQFLRVQCFFFSKTKLKKKKVISFVLVYHFEGKEKYPKVINFWVFFEKIEETCSIPSIKVH